MYGRNNKSNLFTHSTTVLCDMQEYNSIYGKAEAFQLIYTISVTVVLKGSEHRSRNQRGEGHDPHFVFISYHDTAMIVRVSVQIFRVFAFKVAAITSLNPALLTHVHACSMKMCASTSCQCNSSAYVLAPYIHVHILLRLCRVGGYGSYIHQILSINLNSTETKANVAVSCKCK